MAQCDICGSSGMGTAVKARDMSNAVRKGFDPFEKGLADASMMLMGAFGLGGSGPEAWKQSAISGALSQSDWNVCGNCIKELKPYLDQSSSCFIATVCYGSFASPEVCALREFRDQQLLQSRWGRWCVRVYYALSPRISDVLRRHRRLAQLVKQMVVAPVVAALRSDRREAFSKSARGSASHSLSTDDSQQ
jgi:hypothetical protein